MRYLLLILLMILPLSAASAQQSNPMQYAPAVKQAEKYLKSLGTAKARFLQTSADGHQLSGTFYLNRPGKLRFEYDNLDDFIVADGFFIYFYDAELQEQSNAPIGQTLADFLLREDLSLSGDVTVTGLRREAGLLQITVAQSADPQAGTLTLGFNENPMWLKKWRVTDALGNVTEVELFDMQTGISLDNTLFVYRDPQRGTAPRYNN